MRVEAMETVRLLKEMVQNAAETAVSYRLGQTLLKQADRALWAVEKSAKWAVPPSLDQDDSPNQSQELIRPLPWVFFLSLLVVLRLTREGLSFANLIFGKPPVRATDVIKYIQSKRRYLRALKYQGNRNMRARANKTPSSILQVLGSLQSLLEMTMCFKRRVDATKQHNDEDPIMVCKKKKRGMKERESGYASPAQDENAMERLIEKMVDMYGDSSNDSGDSEYTITYAASIKSDTSQTTEEDVNSDATLTKPNIEPASSTPKKSYTPPQSPTDCSDIREYSLLETSSDEAVLGAQSSKNESTNLINSERKVEIQSEKITKSDLSKRRDSEVPLVKIIPTEDSANTNGSSTEGSYCQTNRNRHREKRMSDSSHGAASGKSSNKTKESKIKAPSWKKTKK